MKTLKQVLPKKYVLSEEQKLRQAIRKEIVSVKENLDNMDIALPAPVTKFLDKVTGIIKSYNLPKKKEQLVLAKIVDALGMDKNELMQALSKIKKAGITRENIKTRK